MTTNGDGNLVYESRWALDRAQERAAFEWFIDSTFERMTSFPDLRVYHFGAYQPAAIKRLMLRYATREEEVDRLLRGEVFVDLHSIARASSRQLFPDSLNHPRLSQRLTARSEDSFCLVNLKTDRPILGSRNGDTNAEALH